VSEAPVRYAEDLVPGETVRLGTYRISRAELIAFARQWDPQSFHVDEAAAARNRFGDVIASGLHTLAIFQRLAVLAGESDWAVIAGIRLSDVRFLRPVRPDTVLTGGVRVARIEVEPGRGRALVARAGWLTDDRGRVLEVESEAYVRCRPSGGA
jgi:acyl dehydratase